MGYWLDRLPTHERTRIRAMMSESAYERLRECVKGPEDLERELEKNEQLAELKFALETEPTLKQELKERIQDDIKEQGIEAVLERPFEGDFNISIESNPETNQDQLVVLPEENVSEKIPITSAFNERYLSQFATDV